MKTTKQILMLLLFGAASIQAQNSLVNVTATTPAPHGMENLILGSGAGTSALNSGVSTYATVSNTFLGAYSGNSTRRTTTGGSPVVGSSDTFVGWASGYLNTTGYYNTALGSSAMYYNTSGIENVAIGTWALRGKSGGTTSGSVNVAVGNRALFMNEGSGNTAIGDRAMSNPFSGSISGSNNVGVGKDTGPVLTTGSFNTFVGAGAGGSVSTGSFNTFLGRVGITTDVSNTIVLADGAGNQRLYIDNTGAVGISLGNNTIPTARLDVAGTLRFRGLGTATNTYFLSVDSSGNVSRQTVSAAAGAATNLQISGNTLSLTNPLTVGNQVSVPNIYTANGVISANRYVDMDSKRLVFDTQANGGIYIGNTVNLGSGDPFDNANFPTTTGSYKLYVEGAILAEKIKIAQRSGAWADYVFADDYKLMTLQELETFIKANKHLPGIESAEEVQANGLDLSDMQTKQMAKIEELTLNLIEQQKIIEQQNQ